MIDAKRLMGDYENNNNEKNILLQILNRLKVKILIIFLCYVYVLAFLSQLFFTSPSFLIQIREMKHM